MKRLCDRTEVIESREIGDATYEVCARVVGTYNDSVDELTVPWIATFAA